MSDTLLHYALSPTTLTANTFSELTLTISNPADSSLLLRGEADSYDGLHSDRNQSLPLAPSDEISLFPKFGTQPDCLTSNFESITVGALDSLWNISKVPGSEPYIRIWPKQTIEIPSGATYRFLIGRIQVNASGTSTNIDIYESFGGDTSLPISIQAQTGLSITAYSVPITVTQDAYALLRWTVTNALKVVIDPGDIQRPTSGSGPYSDQYKVKPSAPSTTYTLTAYTQSGDRLSTLVVIYVGNVSINLFSADVSQPIDLNQTVTLSWETSYASEILLTLASGPRNVSAKGSLLVAPKDLLVGNESEVSYYLQAKGYGGPVTKRVNIRFNPAQVLYYRYIRDGFSITEHDEFNTTGFREDSSGTDKKLTVTGPAGPLVRHLGPGPYLQISNFYLTPALPQPGSSARLSWKTLNAVALSIQPGGPLPADQIAAGGQDITAVEGASYTLTATDESGQQITSLLTVSTLPLDPNADPDTSTCPGHASHPTQLPSSSSNRFTRAELFEIIIACTLKVKPSLAQHKLLPQTRFDQFRISSLELVAITFEIEDFFQISIIDSYLDQFETLEEALKIVIKLLKQKGVDVQ